MTDTRRFTNAQIDRLLRPKSVAVVGASDRHGALGATLLNNLVQYEFDGDIYPVNPKRDELLGLKANCPRASTAPCSPSRVPSCSTPCASSPSAAAAPW